MSNSEDVDRPSIIYRLVEPSDLEVLEHLHAALFPIRYEREFFLNVVNRRGIVSWVAVDTGGSDSEDDQLIGFVTTRIIAANESEIEDLLKYDASRRDQVLVYILTLGVAPQYRKRGIANSLVQEVIKYASNMQNCRGVYLHVIAYNKPAIKFYKKMQFKHVRRLPHFYYIQGQHYDSLLFVFFVNDGRSPCCPLDIVAAVATFFKGFCNMLAAKLWKNEEKKMAVRVKFKETSGLLLTHSKRIASADNAVCQFV